MRENRENPRNRQREAYWQGLMDAAQEVFSAPFMRGDEALWRAVILQAMLDAVTRSRKPEAEHTRGQARKWLASRSRDFALVCDLGGMEPSYVRRMAKKVLACGGEPRTKRPAPQKCRDAEVQKSRKRARA